MTTLGKGVVGADMGGVIEAAEQGLCNAPNLTLPAACGTTRLMGIASLATDDRNVRRLHSCHLQPQQAKRWPAMRFTAWLALITIALSAAVSAADAHYSTARLLLMDWTVSPNLAPGADVPAELQKQVLSFLQSEAALQLALDRCTALNPKLLPCKLSLQVEHLICQGEEPRFTRAFLSCVTDEVRNRLEGQRGAVSDKRLTEMEVEAATLEGRIKACRQQVTSGREKQGSPAMLGAEEQRLSAKLRTLGNAGANRDGREAVQQAQLAIRLHIAEDERLVKELRATVDKHEAKLAELRLFQERKEMESSKLVVLDRASVAETIPLPWTPGASAKILTLTPRAQQPDKANPPRL
jgi:hypothetical protein